MSSGCELFVLAGGPRGRIPLSHAVVPGQRAQLGLNIPVFHTPFHPATHKDTQGRSVPFQPSWSCLPSPCYCRDPCVRGFLCLFLPSASVSLHAVQIPDRKKPTIQVNLFSDVLFSSVYFVLSPDDHQRSIYLSTYLSVHL